MIDTTLENNRIKKQAYHGGTFTGNHCHRYLKKKIFEKLTSEIVREAGTYTTDNSILSKTKLLQSQFNKLNNLFREVHLALSHSKQTNS